MLTAEQWLSPLHNHKRHKVDLIAFIFPMNNWASSCLTSRRSHFPLEVSSLPELAPNPGGLHGPTWGDLTSTLPSRGTDTQVSASTITFLAFIPSWGWKHPARFLISGKVTSPPPASNLPNNHQSFTRKKALSSQGEPQSRVLNVHDQDRRPHTSLSLTVALRVPAVRRCWVQILQPQNHCLSLVPRNSALVAPELTLLNHQNQC